MGFGDGFNKQYPGLENSGSTDIKVTGSLLVTGDLTVLGSSNIGGGSGGDALTGSTNIFRADQIISGNLDISGILTAKEFHVTQVTSSILYTSGSTKFGDTADDTHQFTGSVISSVGFTGSLKGDVGEFTIDRNINHNYPGSLNTISSSSPSTDVYGNILIGYDNELKQTDGSAYGNIISAYGTQMDMEGATYGNIILVEDNTLSGSNFQGNIFNVWSSNFSGMNWYSNYFGGESHDIAGVLQSNLVIGEDAQINTNTVKYNTIFGFSNTLTGSNDIESNLIHGNSNTISSVDNTISNSAILGAQNSSSHSNVILLGEGLASTNISQLVAGRFNATGSTYQFAIGNGTDGDNRSNVLEISNNEVKINGTVSGSFIGDGSQLTGISGLTRTARIIYVNAGYAGSAESGSLLAPYKTIQAAHDYASSSYSTFSEPVVIDIAPGVYVENLTITRHNTYFRSVTSKSEQRSVTITGLVDVNCVTATQKYNQIVGFEGLFFQYGANDNSTVTIQGNGNHLTYFRDCYFYNTNGASNSACLTTTNTNTFNDNKIVIQNCIFKGEGASGWDGIILNFAGGDIRIDGSEISTTGTGGNGYGIYISGNTVCAADRVLLDIDVDQYAIYNGSTILDATTKLLLSNASVRTTAGSPLATIYAGNITFLWNVALGGSAPKVSGNLSAPNPLSAVVYSSLTSITPGVSIVFNDVTQSPLTETHGVVIASALSGNLSSSYIQGTIPVSKGGTGATTFGGNSLLIASGSSAFVSLTGSNAADKYVVAWNATGSNFVLTASAGGGGLASVLTSGSITGSGVFGNEVALKANVEASTFTASVGFSGTLYGQASSALTASYINPLTQSVYINGDLSASSGITGSFSGNGAGITGLTGSQINSFVSDVQAIANASGIRAISGSTNISVTSGQYLTASLNNDITLQNIILTGKITAVSGSFQVIENVSASSLQIGDKYIMMVSGAGTHLEVDGAGILWGSGSTDGTVYTENSSSAAILYNSSSDTLVAYPRLSSSFTGTFSGDGSQLTNISVGSLTGVVKAVSATSPLSASVDGSGTASLALMSSSVSYNGVPVALGGSGSIPLVQSLNASSSILISSSSLSGAVNIDLAKSLGGLTISGSVFSGSFSGSYIGDGSGLTGITVDSFNGTILVNSGGTGITSVPSGALLLGSSSTQLSTLSGTIPQLGYVAAWTSDGFALQATGSGLPSSGGQGHLLIVSGSSYKWVAIDPSSSIEGKPFTFNHSANGIFLSQSSAISINSGGLGSITQTTGAIYVLDTVASKFVPVVGTTSQFLAWDGAKWAATDGFSRQVYTTATPSLATKQIVALSGGLVAATAADRLKANAFGVIQTSGSSGYVVQTSGEVLVAFSTSNPTLLVTGSELYVSSSGTASLYEDISGNPNGVYATQIGYLNRRVGSDYYIIISPRPFGLVY